MKITYLLPDMSISGTSRVALAQADALIARGHAVRIATTAESIPWRSSRAEWVSVPDLKQYAPAPDEVIVPKSVIQGFPIVDEELYRARLPRENAPLRVLLCGESQSDEKGVGDGYGAVAHARWFHHTVDLVRVARWAPSREEPLDSVQTFHVGLTASEMTRLMHACDLFLAASRREETFALLPAEALAAGLACVMTEVEAHFYDATRDYALFAPEANGVELGEALVELLDDSELRARLRARGREIAEQWRAERVSARLEKALTSLPR